MSTNEPPLPTVSTVDHVPLELPDLPADPLVSIVVTCYNRDGFIRDCLDSALGQSHEPFEVLVYDDGSTDGSVEIISQIADRDPRVTLIASPERRGHIPAINEAYSIASGSIVCLLDSDDLFRRDKVEQVVKAFRRAPRAGIVLHPVTFLAEDGRTSKGLNPSVTAIPQGWVRDRVLAAGGLLAGCPPTSGISLRREVAERLFPLSGDFTHPDVLIPDVLMLGQAATITELSALYDPLAKYRIHAGNISGVWRADPETIERDTRRFRTTNETLRRWLASQPGGGSSALARLEDTLTYSEHAMTSAIIRGRRLEAWRASRAAAASAEYAMLPVARRAFIRVAPLLPVRVATGTAWPGSFRRLVSAVRSGIRTWSTKLASLRHRGSRAPTDE